jgi:hypothetical protein
VDLDDDLARATALAESLPTMATTEPAVETDILKPEKPIMGEVLLLSKDSWSAWTGGMPIRIGRGSIQAPCKSPPLRTS